MRSLIVHYHIYKNAGTSVDEILKSSLGDRWVSFEGPGSDVPMGSDAFEEFLREQPSILAVSSHQLRPPSPRGLAVFPICFLRHPLDRIRSIFDYQKLCGKFFPELGDCRDMGEFAKWILTCTPQTVGLRNGQTVFLSRANFDMTPVDLARDGASDEDFGQAFSFLRACPVVGIVDRFSESIELLAEACPAEFPIKWVYAAKNVTNGLTDTVTARLSELKSLLGNDLYAALESENEKDILLYDHFRNQLILEAGKRCSLSELPFTGERYVPGSNLVGAETHAEHQLRYKAAAKLVAGKIVLDVACGEGFGTNILGRSAQCVYGVDVSRDAVRHAELVYAEQDNCHFQCANATALPFPDQCFDVVVSFETIEHIGAEDQRKFIAEVFRVLRADGIFIASTPNRINYSEVPGYHNQFHMCELNESEFRELLAPFRVFSLFRQSVMSFPAIWSHCNREFSFDGILMPDELDAVYFIVVCGKIDSPAPKVPLSSLCYDARLSHNALQQRLREKEAHIARLSSWGATSNENVLSLQTRILELNEEVKRRGEWGIRLHTQISEMHKCLHDILLPKVDASELINSGSDGLPKDVGLSIVANMTNARSLGTDAKPGNRAESEVARQDAPDKLKELFIRYRDQLEKIGNVEASNQDGTGSPAVSDHDVRLDALNRELEVRNKRISELLEETEALQSRIKELTGYLNARNSCILNLEGAINENAHTSKALTSRIEQLETEVLQLGQWGISQDGEIRQRDERIVGLQSEVERLGAWGRDNDHQVEERNKIIAKMEIDSLGLAGWAKALTAECESKDKRILALQEEVGKLAGWGSKQNKDIELRDALILEKDGEVVRLAEWGKSLSMVCNEKDRRILSLQAEVDKLAGWGSQQNKDIELRDALILEKDGEVVRLAEWGKSLSMVCDEKDRRILSLQAEVERLAEWGLNEGKTIKERDARIFDLQSEVERIGAWGRRNEAMIAEQDRKIDDFGKENERLRNMSMQYSGTLSERNNRELELLGQIEEWKGRLADSATTIAERDGLLVALACEIEAYKQTENESNASIEGFLGEFARLRGVNSTLIGIPGNEEDPARTKDFAFAFKDILEFERTHMRLHQEIVDTLQAEQRALMEARAAMERIPRIVRRFFSKAVKRP